MSKPIPPRYKTTNWASYNAALKRRGSLTIWFDPAIVWEVAPSGKRGGQQAYSDAAIQACLTLKVAFGMALRQTTGFVASLLKLACLDWSVPDFSTLSRRQKDLAVALPRRTSTGPMHLLIPSRRCFASPAGQWTARVSRSKVTASGTLPAERTQAWPLQAPSLAHRRWIKLHLAVDAETLEVQAVEVTGAGVGDPPMLPELLSQIPPDQDIATVTADGAYNTRKCYDTIAGRGADAVIPPRKNACPWKPSTKGAIVRNEALRACKRFSRSVWKRWSGYHRRSLAETKMNCVKRLGQSIMAREFDRQVAELQIRINVLNRFTALGTSETIAIQKT